MCVIKKIKYYSAPAASEAGDSWAPAKTITATHMLADTYPTYQCRVIFLVFKCILCIIL